MSLSSALTWMLLSIAVCSVGGCVFIGYLLSLYISPVYSLQVSICLQVILFLPNRNSNHHKIFTVYLG